MKIVLYNLREDELKILENWQKNHSDHFIEGHREALNLDTIAWAKGADTVSLSSVKKIPNEIYHKLHELGIKVISQRSAGVDMHNLQLIKELGMVLINVPSYSPNAIAEYVLYSTMYFTRNMHRITQNVSKQDFRWQLPILAQELRTLTIGIVGTGNIGMAAAKLFNGMGAKVLGYDIYQNSEAKNLLTYVSLEELYAQADVITFHIPATKENFHMINEDSISQMKDGVIIINAARGSIVDTKSLLKALDSGKIKAAALDVYENEFDLVNKDRRNQDIDDDIFKDIMQRDNVIYTPHIAFYTETALDNLLTIAVDESINYLTTGASKNAVKL